MLEDIVEAALPPRKRKPGSWAKCKPSIPIKAGKTNAELLLLLMSGKFVK